MKIFHTYNTQIPVKIREKELIQVWNKTKKNALISLAKLQYSKNLIFGVDQDDEKS